MFCSAEAAEKLLLVMKHLIKTSYILNRMKIPKCGEYRFFQGVITAGKRNNFLSVVGLVVVLVFLSGSGG